MKTCDACEETWEDEFFCPKCSEGSRLIEEEVPNLMWSGWPPGGETITEEVDCPNGDICLNCCICHWRKK